VNPDLWAQTEGRWRVLQPTGFEDEAALQRLVEATPSVLPLAGSPQIAVIGWEVALGPGFADLLAVEATGRPVVIEVKLGTNPEAKRAILSQILAYAAFLRGLTREELETRINPYIRDRYGGTLADSVAGLAADAAAFDQALNEHLESGRFRLVLVLDSVPSDLVRLVGYFDSVTEDVAVDLVEVKAYDVGGERILVPRRVETASAEGGDSSAPRPAARGEFAPSPDLFDETLASLPDPVREKAMRLRRWAAGLADAGLARLESYRGPTYTTLLPRLPEESVGPVTIYTDGRTAFIGLYRQVLERSSPDSISAIETAAAPAPVGRGTSVHDVSDDLLAALTSAYRQARRGGSSGVGSSSPSGPSHGVAD
jgi:hypothetical protein